MRHPFEINSAAGGGGTVDLEIYGMVVEAVVLPHDSASASMTLDIQEVHAFAADDEEVSLMNPQITVAADARVLLAGTKDDDNRGGPPVASGTVRLTIAGAGSALTPALRGWLVTR
ncbi:MAG: hypothetical protein CL607_15045 [Anaerolineaceae bacterium]|nr:hypothetical protein [Anaerolineaceae bacterium]